MLIKWPIGKGKGSLIKQAASAFFHFNELGNFPLATFDSAQLVLSPYRHLNYSTTQSDNTTLRTKVILNSLV